ncbi:MAG: T9SS type A sorting domain-containing protein [Chitinophagales bacterium]
MGKFYPFLFFLFSTVQCSFVNAQLFIDDGTNGSIYIRNSSGGTLGAYDNNSNDIALFIDGNFTNDGTFDEQTCEIQLTGNISNSGTYLTSGDLTFVSAPNVTITTSIQQRITGSFTGSNSIYNLILQKNNSQYLEIASNVEIGNNILFNNSGRIRKDIVPHGNDGSAYSYELYLKNGSATALAGYSTGNGATDKYIEGKFRRKINATGTYYFPIGVSPTALDGMEAFELNFTANPNMDFISYLKPSTQTPVTRNVLCDVGKDPGAGGQQFPQCSGTPDGIFDWYYLEPGLDLTHEWVVSPSGSKTGYNYGITLHPGNILDVNNASNYYTIPSSCGNPYQNKRLRIIAKDGIVGGNLQSGPGNWAPWMHLTSFIWCQFDNADLDISLNGQTSFSSFRIHGTNLASNTTLPVELTQLQAIPVNNTYININWQTASEYQNKGFELERSTDGINFNKIFFAEGYGTTAQPHHYTYDDKTVQKDIRYYYRLKQIDVDDNHHYSKMVYAELEADNKLFISDIYPNPSFSASSVNIYTPEAEKINYTILNTLGQEIRHVNTLLLKGNNTLSLDMNSLPKGSYFISFIVHDDVFNTQKLIVQ